MSADHQSPRRPQAEISPWILERWSPRAFDPTPISPEELASLFEAARWAPSCFNEQPWLFIYATRAEDRAQLLPTLAPKNQEWAQHAPVLFYVISRRRFARNDKPNDWAAFDAGAAWLSLALQAHSMGLATHAMGGFDKSKAYAALGVNPEEYDIHAAVAAGRRGDPAALSADMAKIEGPRDNRQPLEEIARPLSN